MMEKPQLKLAKAPNTCPFPKCGIEITKKSKWCLTHIQADCVFPPCTNHVREHSNFCQQHDIDYGFLLWGVQNMQKQQMEAARVQQQGNALHKRLISGNGGGLR